MSTVRPVFGTADPTALRVAGTEREFAGREVRSSRCTAVSASPCGETEAQSAGGGGFVPRAAVSPELQATVRRPVQWLHQAALPAECHLISSFFWIVPGIG